MGCIHEDDIFESFPYVDKGVFDHHGQRLFFVATDLDGQTDTGDFTVFVGDGGQRAVAAPDMVAEVQAEHGIGIFKGTVTDQNIAGSFTDLCAEIAIVQESGKHIVTAGIISGGIVCLLLRGQVFAEAES